MLGYQTNKILAPAKHLGVIMESQRFLGFDLSTQSLTAVVIDVIHGKIQQFSINFDSTYPAYRTQGGCSSTQTPPWSTPIPGCGWKPWTTCCGCSRKTGCPDRFAVLPFPPSSMEPCISKNLFSLMAALPRLDASRPFTDQLSGVFSRATAPVWMDSSTHKECEEITEALGGDQAVAAITGSRATERFAGPQIRKSGPLRSRTAQPWARPSGRHTLSSTIQSSARPGMS